MEADPDETLRVQADQHHVLPPELVGQRSEDQPADHDAAEVDGGDERPDEGPVADEAPLEKETKIYSVNPKTRPLEAVGKEDIAAGVAGRETRQTAGKKVPKCLF